jgi:hypothetical protein
MAHLKRPRTSGREVFFTPSMKLTTTKEEFLSCTENKSRFIKELARYLTTKGFETTRAEGDADLLIVKTAILSSKTSKTILIGEDTDLLCLMLHYSREIIFPLFFKSEPTRGKIGKMWNLTKIKEVVGELIYNNILFAHAILGCDTTSKPYGVGKAKSLKLLSTSTTFQMMAAKFYEQDATIGVIKKAGEVAMIYGGSTNEGIDTLRYKEFQRKISIATSFVNPLEIPSTSAAIQFHSQGIFSGI